MASGSCRRSGQGQCRTWSAQHPNNVASFLDSRLLAMNSRGCSTRKLAFNLLRDANPFAAARQLETNTLVRGRRRVADKRERKGGSRVPANVCAACLRLRSARVSISLRGTELRVQVGGGGGRVEHLIEARAKKTLRFTWERTVASSEWD